MKLSELATLTGARIDGGTDDIEILGAAGLDDARHGQVTFLANPRYTPRVNSTLASAIYVAEGVMIHPHVTVYDEVKIGRDSVIHSGVAIRERTSIGERVVVHNNTVIGCDGFGYAKDEEQHWLKIPQAGRVVIEDDVEIGAGTTIDRASVGESRIGRGSKIDNLVQIGHSCTVGE